MINIRRTGALRTGFLVRCETTSVTQYPRPVKTTQKGINILHDPLWNKGMAFPISERDRLGLRGLLPPIVKSQEAQIKRALQHVSNSMFTVALLL